LNTDMEKKEQREQRMPPMIERLIVLLLAILVFGFALGILSHDAVFRPDSGHVVWRSADLSE
jgi:hypothetical protein